MKEQLDRILAKIGSIETKLDKVIKALQEYDGLDEDFNEPKDEYAWEGIGSTEAETNRRMDIIGQNGNEGLHYEEKPKPKKRYYKPKKKK